MYLWAQMAIRLAFAVKMLTRKKFKNIITSLLLLIFNVTFFIEGVTGYKQLSNLLFLALFSFRPMKTLPVHLACMMAMTASMIAELAPTMRT